MKKIYTWIDELLKPIEKPTIFEIGAYKGTDTIKLCNVKDWVTLHAFEPDPRNSLEHCPDNVIKNYIALSDKEGELEFYQSDKHVNNYDWSCSSSIRKPKNHLQAYDYVTFKQEPIKVKSSTLDIYCKEKKINKIDFIWMDVQGAEGDVIEGGIETLKKTRYLYTEYSDKELYEGEISLNEIIKKLPGSWTILEKYQRANDGDVLLKNNNFEG